MATCANCNASISEGQEVILPGKDKNSLNVTVCSTCAQELERAFRAETEDINIVGASLFGVGAAVVSSLIWYGFVVFTKLQWGLISIIVGWLVAQAVVLGSGRKRGAVLQVISIVITIVAMAFSEWLIVRHYANIELAKEGLHLPLFIPLKDMGQIIVESIKEDFLILLFWGIAVWEAYAIPAPRQLKKLN